MQATAVTALPATCPGGCVYEPKWDGWRALLFVSPHRVLLQSRTGKPLAAYFPDLTRMACGFLPVGTVLDGELIIWDEVRGRTSFALLHRRITAGRALLREATAHPAHMVFFDVLQLAGRDVMADPLARRREHLARVLADAPRSLTLCPQTTDPAVALAWLDEWWAAGVEGLVIKGLATPYQPGRRGWAKLRARSTTEAIIGGVTGTLVVPETVLLGRLDDAGRVRYAGRTVPLAPHQRRELAAILTPTGRTRRGEVDHPWPIPLPAAWLGQLGNTTPLPYQQVAPAVVAEVEVDAAFEYGRWRHQPRFVRVRADLSVYDVPPHASA
ncbi:MAG TPA: ATP-dependent DNA ligase [Kribbellaceae bacterium]|nr:ATP-dependent DNA ligase [Kribbellaceae bacterium]